MFIHFASARTRACVCVCVQSLFSLYLEPNKKLTKDSSQWYATLTFVYMNGNIMLTELLLVLNVQYV